MKHDDKSNSNNSTSNNTNGRPKSGGPKTPEGRARSARNSQRHGILSETIAVLSSETEEKYLELLNGYLDELKPVGFLETRLIQQMAWAEWRQIRAIRVESATIDDQMDLDNPKWQRECPGVDDDTRSAHAIRTLVDESNDLQHLSRYETRFNRMYHRALKQLLELQEKRRLDGQTADPTQPAPSPADPADPENINLPNEQPAEPAQAIKFAPEARTGPVYTPRNVRTQPESPPRLSVAAA